LEVYDRCDGRDRLQKLSSFHSGKLGNNRKRTRAIRCEGSIFAKMF
jgi:hypothetical protein